MRRWARLRTEAPQAPEGEPDPEAVEVGGPVGHEPEAMEVGGPVGHEPEAGEEDRAPDGSQAATGDGRSAAGTQARLTPAPHPAPPVVVPRWVQIVVLPLALLGVWALARASGSVLLILIVAGTVALIAAPIVRFLETFLPRGVAIFLVYLGTFAILAGIGVLLASPVTTQISRFANNVPALVRHANQELANVQTFLDNHGINVHIKAQGQSALQTLQRNVLKRSGDIVSFSRDLLSEIVTIGFDFILTLVLSVYLLVYGRDIGNLARRIMPPGDGTPADDYPLLVQRAVSGYVRGQVLFSLIMGGSAAIALEILGVVGIFPAGKDYGLFFGAFYGLMEFIPYIGPIIGPVPAVLVALFENPISALWLVLLFVALQQLEGHVVAPQVFRISLRINPVIIILALLVGYQLYGIAGALVALPVIAVIRETVLYLRRHLVLEPWGTRGVGLGLMSDGPDRCPDCGTPAAGGDAYCRACGASLEPRVSSPR